MGQAVSLTPAANVQRMAPGRNPEHRRRLMQLMRGDFLDRRRIGRSLWWAAEQAGRPIGAVSAVPWDFLVYRDDQTFEERLGIDARLDYPILPTHRPDLALQLIDAAVAHLRAVGTETAYLSLPVDSHGPQAVAEAAGFIRIGIRTVDRRAELVFATHLGPPTRRHAIYRFARSSTVRSTASGADAPRPDSKFWVENPVYSGFSGYPFLAGLLDEVMPTSCRRFLSVPCATGDAVRMLGQRPVEVAVGLDLNPNALELARARFATPALDETNARLNRVFLVGGSRAAATMAREVAAALMPGADDLITPDAIAQLSAAARFGIGASNAVTDFWLVFKGLAELAGRPDGMHPLAWLASLVGRPETATALGRIAAGAQIVLPPPSCQARFEQVDLLGPASGGERFDCVFCFEAALMFFASGKQDEFLDTLLARLAPGGRLVLTGVGVTGRAPQELRWAAEALAGRGLAVRAGVHRPSDAAWAPVDLIRPFPYLTADLSS